MDATARFHYYIKHWTQRQTAIIPECAKSFFQDKLFYYAGPASAPPPNFPFQYGCWTPGFWWDQRTEFSLDIPCLCISADGIDNQGLPAIAKVRRIDEPLGSILGPLEFARHWGLTSAAKSNNLPWESKRADCIWRGAPTGAQTLGENARINFCDRWMMQHDVGITCTWDLWDSKYLRPTLTVPQMLQYKYVISIPGKDKDSGLNWKLASNSVVLMAKPQLESWLMEGMLQPRVHYIQLKDDYSDLDDVLTWCRANDDACQEIVRNANQFMTQFENMETETRIFSRIKQFYLQTFTFV